MRRPRILSILALVLALACGDDVPTQEPGTTSGPEPTGSTAAIPGTQYEMS